MRFRIYSHVSSMCLSGTYSDSRSRRNPCYGFLILHLVDPWILAINDISSLFEVSVKKERIAKNLLLHVAVLAHFRPYSSINTKGTKKMISLLVEIIPTCVVRFEVRTTISCNSRLASANFSCAIHESLINSIAISAYYKIYQARIIKLRGAHTRSIRYSFKC